MAQNVLVCCRFRPPSQREIEERAEKCIEVLSDQKTCQLALPSAAKKNSFNFDHVFDTNATQEDVFENTAKPMVKEFMNGYNTTIFAYGQTGSGKTYTMMGDRNSDTSKGIIPRLIDAIFEAIASADEDIEFTIKLSYLEIYNERLRDLLNPEQDNLRIRENATSGVWVQDVTESYVGSYDEVLEVMAAGEQFRAIAATKMNMESSRSHSVFILTLGQLHQKTGSRKGSKLTLVDLAGSEKVLKTGAEGQTLVEAQHINKSLSSLGNVINALTSNSKHIPYRDSKLTRLLSDSLGGNSKTCLIIACSPCSTNADETLSTLRFGTRAKMIKNKPTVNQERSVAEYKRLLAAREATILKQQSYIQLLEADVEALLKCVNAVLPANLVLPIPVLRSRAAGAKPVRPAEEETATTTTTTTTDASGEEDERDEKESKEPALLETDFEPTEDKMEEKVDIDQMQERVRDAEDQVHAVTTQRNELEVKLQEAMKAHEEMARQLAITEEKAAELSRMQKKLELTAKESELQAEQLRAEKEELATKLNTLTKDEKAEPRGRSDSLTAPPSPRTPPAFSSPESAKQLLEVKRLKQNYASIMLHLKKKTEQYNHMQVLHQATKEILKATEEELAIAKRTIADGGAAQRKIKELESQLEKSEEICNKLFASGGYFQQRRGSRKLPLSIKGGKKAASRTGHEEGKSPERPESPIGSLSRALSSGGPVALVGGGGKIIRVKSTSSDSMDQFF